MSSRFYLLEGIEAQSSELTLGDSEEVQRISPGSFVWHPASNEFAEVVAKPVNGKMKIEKGALDTERSDWSIGDLVWVN